MKKTCLPVCIVFGLVFIIFCAYLMSHSSDYFEQLISSKYSGASYLIMDNKKNVLDFRLGKSQFWQLPIFFDECSKWMIQSTIAYEDKRFYRHPGVDLIALFRAVIQNLSGRKRISGASTISMQTIRLLKPRKRTYKNKLIEMILALCLEFHYSKEKILEIYLNLAPYGGNVVGIEAASRKYFNKPSASLTLGETSFLTVIPQRPSYFNPVKNIDRVLKKRAHVLRAMIRNKMITQEDELNVMQYPVVLNDLQKKHHPRFSDLIVGRVGQIGGIHKTTLDSGVQNKLNASLKKFQHYFCDTGIDAVGVVVVRPATCEMLGMIGSLDPFNRFHGCVNTVLAKRQPGSLLKPFIYGVAFEKGYLTPDSQIMDCPKKWVKYSPNNMDHQFMGQLSVREALQQSRNVPAVDWLEKIGIESFQQKLFDMNLLKNNSKVEYGLSMALGTMESNLIRLVCAYASLANEGNWQPLKLLNSEQSLQKVQVFSPGAAYLTLRALGINAPEENFKMAHKTGTSWNNRDAWAIIITKDFIVGVWLGLMSGQSNPHLVGSESALPFARDILNKIFKNHSPMSFERPESIQRRKICCLSGEPASFFCKKVIIGEYLCAQSLNTPCKNLQCFNVSKTNDEIQDIDKPYISFPKEGGDYIVPEYDLLNKTMHFKVQTQDQKDSIYWFMNGKFLKHTKGLHECSWPVSIGIFELKVVNSIGGTDMVRFSINQL